MNSTNFYAVVLLSQVLAEPVENPCSTKLSLDKKKNAYKTSMTTTVSLPAPGAPINEE
jgi:hypothetical protein